LYKIIKEARYKCSNNAGKSVPSQDHLRFVVSSLFSNPVVGVIL
jgi:hypothetical protein